MIKKLCSTNAYITLYNIGRVRKSHFIKFILAVLGVLYFMLPYRTVPATPMDLKDKSTSTEITSLQSTFGESIHTALVIIPIRDEESSTLRDDQARVLLSVLRHRFHRLRQSHHFLIVEQTKGLPFNKGVLFNAGFIWGNDKFSDVDYIILHDVDEIPIHKEAPYGYPQKPTHILRRRSKNQFKVMYSGSCGGVVSMQTNHFRDINGFSNSFWGWGREDDDLGRRIRAKFGSFNEADVGRGSFWSLDHPKTIVDEKRFEHNGRILTRRGDSTNDGLNNAKYSIENVEENNEDGYTRIIIKIEDTRPEELKEID